MSNTKDDVDELGTSFATISPMSTSSKMSLSKQLTMYVKLMVQLLPLIVTIFILTVSVILQTLKGFVFLGFLVASYAIRIACYSIFKMFQKQEDTESSEKGYNCGLSVYLLTFTFAYICIPMLFLKNINVMVLAVLLFCIFLDIFYKSSNLCELNMETVFNMIGGSFIGFLMCFLMYMGGSSKYLFFSEVSSKEICSVPKKQKFKCNVFKHGELVKI